jgi:hypothetical protein
MDVPIGSWVRQQAFVANPCQLLVDDDPFTGDTAPGFLFLGLYSSESAPFAHGELGLVEKLGHLAGRIPFLGRTLLHEQTQRLFDPAARSNRYVLPSSWLPRYAVTLSVVLPGRQIGLVESGLPRWSILPIANAQKAPGGGLG